MAIFTLQGNGGTTTGTTLNQAIPVAASATSPTVTQVLALNNSESAVTGNFTIRGAQSANIGVRLIPQADSGHTGTPGNLGRGVGTANRIVDFKLDKKSYMIIEITHFAIAGAGQATFTAASIAPTHSVGSTQDDIVHIRALA